MPKTTVDSFVVRFVSEQTDAVGPVMNAWHGTICHVQSNRQVRFVDIEEALVFIARFVDIPNFGSPAKFGDPRSI